MNIALILAGGEGLRMGGEIPKQFIPLNNKPVIMHSLLTFQKHPQIDEIYIVSNASLKEKLEDLRNPMHRLSKLKSIIIGGNTRKQSSYNGLVEILKSAHLDDIVLIHDAARPLVSSKIITDNIACVKKYGACSTSIRATDTILVSNEGKFVDNSLNRNTIFYAQTPQSFNLGTIISAHRGVIDDYEITDDAGLLIKLGIPVMLVVGDKKNIKLTTPEDFAIVKQYLDLH